MCVFCRRNHASQNCDIIKEPEIRRSIVQNEKRCFVCMALDHMSNDCLKNWKCFKCGGRHNNALCKENGNESIEPHPPTLDPEIHETPTSSTATMSSTKIETVLFPTAKAKISGEKNSANLRLLFDSGSQQTYISPESRTI